MLHSHTPITNNNEVICGSCGIVLGSVIDSSSSSEYNPYYCGIDILMVGTSLEQSINWKFQDNRGLVNKQRILSRFLDITKKYGLNDRIAYETMRRLLKKKKGMYSYKLQIQELLDVLNQDYRFIYKAKAIQQEYQNISGK